MERIGFVGLGIMGSRMAANLRRAGYELTVCNRTRERAEAWAAEHGATVAATPAEVGGGQRRRRHDGRRRRPGAELLLGEDGVAQAARPRARCASTCRRSRPATAGASAPRSAERGIGFVDAPVTGSSPKAEDGTLTIMAGGAPTTSSAPGRCSRRWAS